MKCALYLQAFRCATVYTATSMSDVCCAESNDASECHVHVQALAGLMSSQACMHLSAVHVVFSCMRAYCDFLHASCWAVGRM